MPPTVLDVVKRKGSNVVQVAQDSSVLDAARIMMEGRIGGVLVVDSDEQVVGIFTERDVLRRVVAEQRNASETPISAVMSRDLVTVLCTTSLDACGALMTERRIRHLPVMEGGKLRGIITPGDLLAFRLAEQESLVQTLEHYVYDLR